MATTYNYLGRTFTDEDIYNPTGSGNYSTAIENKAALERARRDLATAQENALRNPTTDYSSNISNAQTAINYYSPGGKGFEDMLRDYQLGIAGEIGKTLGLTASQLYANPELANDPRALAQYTGKPYGGVDYTPGSADWYKLNPTEAPGYVKPVAGSDAPFTQSGQSNIIDTNTLKNQTAFTQPNQNSPTPPPVPVPTPSTEDPFVKAQKDYLASVSAPDSVADEYEAATNDSAFVAKEKEVADLTAKLNLINTNAQVAMQTLESQAGTKDVTSAFLGRQQQEIQRQAAIQGLPVAAQLEAAQGNLQTAQTHIDNLFKFKLEDAKAKNDYNNKVAEIIYKFATDAEQRQLDAKKLADDRAYQEKQDMINRQWDLASTALSNGQGTLFTQISQLDENSATFSQDLANLAGQIKAKTTTTTEQKKSQDWVNARQFIKDNPNASAQELESGLRENTTTLSDADIKSLLSEGRTTKLTRENVSNLFGTPDNNEKSGGDWWLGLVGAGSTNSQKLDVLMDSIKKYQDVGYTDDEILKMMQ